MAKIRVRRQNDRHVYPHNDLRQAAHHHKGTVERRLAAQDYSGVNYDMLAQLVFLAFSVEAQVNFFGQTLAIPGWKERDRFEDKFKKVLKHLKLQVDWNKRPFSTARQLKQLRDDLAHGKPAVTRVDEIVVVDQEDTDDHLFADLKSGWETYCNATFCANAWDDVDAIWEQMRAKSGLRRFDTMTGGSGSMQYIEHVSED